MKPEKVLTLYNRRYASVYDQKFILSDLAKEDSAFEIEILRGLLKSGGQWLDVACGTGYFLSQFPDVERAGIDLSPSMLSLAREANPGVPFYEHDFRKERREWRRKWSLVSCMWYGYCLVDSMSEVKQVICNLADWTSDNGTCFVPICDPELVSTVSIPYHIEQSPWPGKVMITGILWSYIEEQGETHENLVTPQVPCLLEMFNEFFDEVRTINYASGRRAIISRTKKQNKRST